MNITLKLCLNYLLFYTLAFRVETSHCSETERKVELLFIDICLPTYISGITHIQCLVSEWKFRSIYIYEYIGKVFECLFYHFIPPADAIYRKSILTFNKEKWFSSRLSFNFRPKLYYTTPISAKYLFLFNSWT